MSGPSRPVSGFVPIGDMAVAVELPGDRALTPAAPLRHIWTAARHHRRQNLNAEKIGVSILILER